MDRIFIKRPLFYIFSFIILTSFLFWPGFSSAETDISGVINNPDKIELKEKEAKKILNSLIQKISDEWIDISASSYDFNLEKQAVLVIVSQAVKINVAKFFLIEEPQKITKEIILYTIKAGRLVLGGDVSVILDEIEKTTVNKAKEYAINWLLQKEIKTSNGNLEISYRDSDNILQNIKLPYIIVFKPEDMVNIKVAVEIYSASIIKTARPMWMYSWEGGINELQPFIVEISGEVEKQYNGAYKWTERPEIEVVFDELVPEFDFKKPGFFDSIKNRLNEVRVAVDRGVKTIGDLITGAAQKVKDNSGGALDKMKSLFSNLNIFKAFVGGEFTFPQDDSGVDFSKINVENLNSEEQINKITEQLINEKGQLEEAIKESQPGEESDFTLEKAQEILDDISEKIDLLAQEMDELTADSKKISDEFAYENNSEEANPDLSEPADDEEEQDNNKIMPVSTSSSHGGGGGSKPVYSKILISEVQISGLTDEKEEFLELYNPNNEEISLTNWYLHRKTETGASYSTFASSNLFSGKKISANGYFIIARQGSVFTSSADIITDNSLGNNGSSSTLVIKNPNGEISDKLGFGVPQEYETSPAQSPEKGKSLGRKWVNDTEQDTDNNSADFEIQSPSPKAKNSAYVEPSLLPSGGGDKTPPEVVFNLVPEQATLIFDISFEIIDSVTTSSSEEGITEFVTPSGLDGFTFRWNGESGDWQEDAYQKVDSAPLNFLGQKQFDGEDEKIYYFQIKAKDVAGNESVWLPEEAVSAKISVPKKVLINEIQTDGKIGSGGTDDDWVELYNPNDFDISLDGWSIQKHSADLLRESCSVGKSFYKKNFSEDAVIPAKGFFLAVDTEAKDELRAIADMTIGWSLTDNNTIYLVRNQNEIESGGDDDIVDKVGFGLACFAEGDPAPNPPDETSIGRKELGLDTDDNSQDFIVNETISPTNSKNQTLQPTVAAVAIWPVFQYDSQHTGRSNFVGPMAVNNRTAYDLAGIQGSYFTAVLQPIIGPDKTIYFGIKEPEAKLYAMNPDGIKKWEVALDGWAIAIALGPDNVIYASIRDKGIVALDSDGAEKWRFYPDGASEVSAATVGGDGNIYFTDYSNLYCINPDGSQSWAAGNAPRGGEAVGGPAIGPDNTIYVVWTGFLGGVDLDRGQLIAYNSDGTVKWRVPLEYRAGTPIIDSINSIIYVTIGTSGPLGTSRAVLAFGFDGVEKWRSEREDGSFFSALSLDNFLIQADNWSTTIGESWGSAVEQPMSRIKAFDSGGNVVWTIGPESSTDIITWPISDKNGNIYFGKRIYEESRTGDGWGFLVSGYKLYSVDKNGAINWSYDAPGQILSSFAIGDSNNIFVPVSEGSANMKEAVIYSFGE